MCVANLIPIKYINDPIYGGIPITQLELELIDTKIFQRLRKLMQLARVNFVFPAAEHSRYVHSLGVLFIMGLMTEHLMATFPEQFKEEDAIKMRIAALLHDIGHYPLSHLGETVYGFCKGNNEIASDIFDTTTTPSPLYELASAHSKAAHHEQLGKYIVENNIELTTILEKYGLDPAEIASIFTGEIGSRNMVYSQLLHSSMDADRLDYLLRDSFQTGVQYGLVDLKYIIRLLRIGKSEDLGKEVLAINKKGQHVAEHFLMSRYFHYSQIIFHKTNAAFEGMIKALYIKLVNDKSFIFNSLDEIQSNINNPRFLDFTDATLDVALFDFAERSSDSVTKSLYQVYKNRCRPKVIYNVKDLYEESPQKEFSILKWTLKRYPEKISELIGTEDWGYQIVPLTIEKIQSHNKLSEQSSSKEEDLREAIKLYDPLSRTISYLAEDELSVISRLSNYKSEFIRIFVLNTPENESKFDEMTASIEAFIKS